MAGRKKRPVFTDNFLRNLDLFRSFLGSEGRSYFNRLLDRFLSQTVPTLSQFPQAGRSLKNMQTRSLETRRLQKKLESLLAEGEEVRQFISGDHLILYLIRRKEIVFLSIKHHRQLSFDLARFWHDQEEKEVIT